MRFFVTVSEQSFCCRIWGRSLQDWLGEEQSHKCHGLKSEDSVVLAREEKLDSERFNSLLGLLSVLEQVDVSNAGYGAVVINECTAFRDSVYLPLV